MDYQSPTFRRFLAVTRSPYFFILLLLFCIFSYFSLDRQLALFMHTAVSGQLNKIAELLTQLGKGTAYFIILPLLFIFFKFIIKSQRWTRISLFLLVAIILPSLACDIIKVILGRTRPILFFSENLYQFTFFKTQADYLSFPSGHSTLITALMLGLCFVFSRYWLFFFTLLVLVSASRIFITAHFLSDVISGMYLSILIVPWVYQRWFSAALQPYPGSILVNS